MTLSRLSEAVWPIPLSTHLQALEHVSSEADKNIDKLQQETAKLAEHRRNSCPWAVWTMLIFVFIIFFLMVLFIKVTSYI